MAALLIPTLLMGLAHAAPATVDAALDNASRDDVAVLDVGGTPEPQGIINGDDATAEDYPMAGGMMMDATINFGGAQRLQMFVCSSTLIAPDVVLLAAHCLDPDAMTYGFGTVDYHEVVWSRQADLSAYDGSGSADWPSDTVAAWDWVIHENFDLFSLGMGLTENYDIALMFLDEPVLDVPHAYLITPEESDQMGVDDQVIVVGWGQQVATSQWEQPPAGSMMIKQMGTSHIAEIADYEFKVGEEESDVRKCHGDSGGPSFMDVETASTEAMRLVGVTSHAYDNTDCNSTGGVDTRVSYYLDWIDAEMRRRCEDGTRSWCEVEGIVPPPMFGDGEGDYDTGDAGDDTGGVGGSGEEDGGGCGCSASAVSAWSVAPWALGIVGLLVRRRQD